MLTPGSQNPPYVNIQRGDRVEAEWANGKAFETCWWSIFRRFWKTQKKKEGRRERGGGKEGEEKGKRREKENRFCAKLCF